MAVQGHWTGLRIELVEKEFIGHRETGVPEGSDQKITLAAKWIAECITEQEEAGRPEKPAGDGAWWTEPDWQQDSL